MEYPWYAEVADGTLSQGDILTECPAGYLPVDWDPGGQSQEFRVDIFDLIVLTQACDLAHDKVAYVVCCPVHPHTFIDGQNGSSDGADLKRVRKHKDQIIQGIVPGCAMLASYEGSPSRPVSVVSFREVFSLPKVFLRQRAAQQHLRLLPPYREHISQSFARFFMRVGLPIDIPRFNP
jgi:hypothetical protein